MNLLEPAALVQQLNWRYATKRFNPTRKIPAEEWNALEQALVLSPSSFGLQPWKFIIVTDPDRKAALLAHSWNQVQPVDCSHFVVFAVKTGLDATYVDHYLERIVGVRGGAVESLSGFRGVMLGSLDQARTGGFLDLWQMHQVYIALGQFMASAAMLGIDTCPMEGLVPEKYDAELGLCGTGYKTVVACAAGYRADDDKYARLPKVRFPTSEVVQHL